MLDAFHGVDDDRPTCFIAYTIKGFGLPFAGHKDNHAGLMTPTRWRRFKTRAWASPTAQEWEPFAGLDVARAELQAFLDAVAVQRPRAARHERAGRADARELPPAATTSSRAPRKASAGS